MTQLQTIAGTRNACPRCDGIGVTRNNRHFFYGICLIACGILVFFQWPPVPALTTAIQRGAMAVGLPGWMGSAVLWILVGIPALFGIAFLYSWLRADTCPSCNGSRKSAEATRSIREY